jgi:eukaryotic-like serine/threonine-protein kinase
VPVAAGSLVTPNVRLVEQLAEGGMGSIWVAEHEKLEARVAVKFIRPERSKRGQTVLTRFKREASVAAKLQSPHVVRIFDYGVLDEQTPFIVMELLRGETLEQRLQRDGILPLAAAVTVTAQTAKVLSEAHKLGIVHRDIKPANVFLVDHDDEIFVKVLDFGVAKQMDDLASLTVSGAMVGTPLFMSPEQLLGTRDVDHRADLWSLAVVAYECFTGDRPFHADNIARLTQVIALARFEPPSRVCDGLPAGLDDFFARALHGDIDRRFTSAKEMTAALARALGPMASGTVLRELVSADGPSTPGKPKTPRSHDAALVEAATEIGTPPSERPPTPSVDETTAGPLTATATSVPQRRSLGLPVGLALVGASAIAAAVWLSRAPEPAQPRAADAPTAAAAPPPSQSAAIVAPPPEAPPPALAASTASTSTSAARPPPTKAPSPHASASAPPPIVTATAVAKPGKPDYCTTARGFFTDGEGNLVPKPECL